MIILQGNKPFHQEAAGTIYQGGCLAVMPLIPDKSVDMILCDLPYGTTACSWDTVIPFKPLWKEYKRVIKDYGVIVLTASQPFTSALVMSNPGWFKYCWVWDKVAKGDIMNAKNKPLKQHEDIAIFSEGTTANGSKRRMPYFPLGVTPNTREVNKQNRQEGAFKGLRPSHVVNYKRQGTGYPSSILRFSNADHTGTLHPTQKPIALFEYLIRTYTNEGDLVMDNCLGSGTTAVACKNLGRRFLGIELSPEYCAVAVHRLRQGVMDFRECAG